MAAGERTWGSIYYLPTYHLPADMTIRTDDNGGQDWLTLVFPTPVYGPRGVS